MDNQLLNPDHNFYPEDDSFLRFEKAYYQIAKAVYPAWSLEAKIIQQLKNSSQKVVLIAPPETIDNQTYNFYFKQIYDNAGNAWFQFVTVQQQLPKSN
ncbi:hypothetical protein HMPREF2811_02775 [Globicatella sp. HMSC072A10]|uniref:DUF5960 family protein n=1 Tax=Globicatella sp. HMSC072A10 TaxID=1739315 RepID=UPI0008B4B5E9|nr:DUF5960 family protein [Globicatella sp. HMSC072A10]OFK61726.1 hypothetical protein HMPREF2811_02775 [Globicatella sp. HMSC072A10]